MYWLQRVDTFQVHKPKANDRRKLPLWKRACCPPPPQAAPCPTPVSPSPPPPSAPRAAPPPKPKQAQHQPHSKSFNILQHNIKGIAGKINELSVNLKQNNVMIAAIQETKLSSKSKIKPIPNYSLIRKDRGKDKEGELAFIIHNTVPFKKIESSNAIKADSHMEIQTISIKSCTILL